MRETRKFSEHYASEYDSIIQYLNESDLEFVDNVKQIIPSQTITAPDLVLRDYQERAMENWTKSLYAWMHRTPNRCW